MAHPSEDAEYQKRFTYRDAERPSGSIENASSLQLGHMLETLTDAMTAIQLMADQPHMKIDINEDIAYQPDKTRTPDYVRKYVSEPRTGNSYFRTDLGRMREPKKWSDLAYFTEALHMALREQTLAMGRSFQLDDDQLIESARQGAKALKNFEHVKKLAQRYEEMIKDYQALVYRHRNSSLREQVPAQDTATIPVAEAHDHKEKPRPDLRRIPEKELTAFTDKYETLARQLFAALEAMPSVSIKVDNELHSLPNDKRLNPSQPLSYPALVLYRFHTLGSIAADGNVRPQAEFANWSKQITGSESIISDTAYALLELARSHGAPMPDYLNREELKTTLKGHAHQMQMALSFCRIAGCTYDLACKDMELFLRMAGEKPGTIQIREPGEAAFLLYAVDRAFARRGLALGSSATLAENEKTPLWRMADTLSSCTDLPAMRERLAHDEAFQGQLKEAYDLAKEAYDQARRENMHSDMKEHSAMKMSMHSAMQALVQISALTQDVGLGHRAAVLGPRNATAARAR